MLCPFFCLEPSAQRLPQLLLEVHLLNRIHYLQQRNINSLPQDIIAITQYQKMSSTLTPSSSVSTPQAPLFSSIKFKTIGQPPDLLKRFSDPANVSEYKEEDPDNSMPVSRQSTPKPSSKVEYTQVADRVGRPSLLQALGDGSGDGMAMDGDIVMASPSAPMTGQQLRAKSGTPGRSSAADMTAPAQTGAVSHVAYPQSSVTGDKLARSNSLSRQNSNGNDITMSHYNAPLTAHETQRGVQVPMQTSDANTFNNQSPRPTPELLYPSSVPPPSPTYRMPPPSPLLNSRRCDDNNSANASTLGTTTTSNSMSDIIASRNLLQEKVMDLRAQLNLNVTPGNGVANANGPLSQSESRLSLQIGHEHLYPQANQSSVSPDGQADPNGQTQTRARVHPNIEAITHLSVVPPMNIPYNDNLSPASSHSHSQPPRSSQSPLDSSFDSAKKWLDNASLAHAQFQDLLARAVQDASTARTQAAIAREEATGASTMLRESQARNALLNQENVKLKEGLDRLQQRIEEQGELERKVEETIIIVNEVMRLVDELVRKKAEEDNIEEQKERERNEVAMEEAERAAERTVAREKERLRLAESQAQAEEETRRQKDAELRLQREQDLLHQQAEKERELQRDAEEAVEFAKERAEVMKEKERVKQENATKIRLARERQAAIISSPSPSPVDNSHAAQANDGTPDGRIIDGGVSTDDSMVVAAPVAVPARVCNDDLLKPKTSAPLAIATPSIFQDIGRSPGFSPKGAKESTMGPASIQPSSASHTINLRHLKADRSKNLTIGVGVKEPAPTAAEVKATTDVKIKTEVKRGEEDMNVVVKMEEGDEDEEGKSVSSSRPNEPVPDHQAHPPLQAIATSPRLPSRPQPHSKSHAPISEESCSLPPADPPASVMPTEMPMSLSHGAAPPLSRPSSGHSAASQPSDVDLSQAPEPYGYEPTRSRPHHSPISQPQPRPSFGSAPLGRGNGWYNNEVSEPLSRPVPPGELSDRRPRYSPPWRGREMTMRRWTDHPNHLPPPSHWDHYSPPPDTTIQPYSPPPSPVPTRNARSRKRPRRANSDEDGLPARRPWQEDLGYERPVHERPPVEPRYTQASIRERIGPQTPPLPNPDYRISEPEPVQYSSRGRTRTSGPEQYNYDQERTNVGSGHLDHGTWEHRSAYMQDTYATATGLSTSNDATTIPSTMEIDGPQGLVRRKQSPSQDTVPLIDRISDTQQLLPLGPVHNRQASNQARGGGQSTRGLGQARQPRGRGGPRGGAVGSSERQSLAKRLGSSTLQQRLS